MLILIVEDDDRVAQFLQRGLVEEGHTVDRAATAEEAIRQCPAQPYDVVLLDWALPDGDGISVLRTWRESGVTAPVIMLTARGGVDATVLALDEGADDYVEKPFSFEELLARIRAHGRRAEMGGDSGTTVEIGAATVDLRRRTVVRDDSETELTPREFDLFDLMLKRRGEVLSRSLILDRAWGMSHDPTTNVVDVYVRYLRNKLDDEASDTSVIETVRGRGYRLRTEEELS
jgi:DNA-binding response OmpR family regulator